MKPINKMTAVELAAFIQSFLWQAGIRVVLSGGSAVSFYSENKYLSKDIDLVDPGIASRKQISLAMQREGFTKNGRYFSHPDTEILVEFPAGPLSVGNKLVASVQEFPLETGILRILSATDCVKDRLSAYYYWGDLQGLEQAVMVAKHQAVDLPDVEHWSQAEGHALKFQEFIKHLTS